MTEAIDYAVAGLLTTIGTVHKPALDGIPTEAVGICDLVRALVIQPTDATRLGVSQERFADNQLRPVEGIAGALLALDPAPLTVGRGPARRVIGTCRHFAVLSCALLRYRGIAARARCGFATYFQPGQGLDHWITEYQHDGRWVRIDSEVLAGSIVTNPEDLADGEFLIRDLAALNKVEMLPWDEWGRMDASYQGNTGPDYDELIDTIAAVSAADDRGAGADLYASADLAVPTAFLR